MDRKVRTESGSTLGKLRDLCFVDDPKYAEVTSLLIGRPFGHLSLNVPWENVIEINESKIVVQDSPSGGYPEVKNPEDYLLLRAKVLDKRIIDLEGFDVDVVYDIRLLLTEKKLFIVAADVSRNALMHRVGLGFIADHLLGHPSRDDLIPYRYVQPLGSDLSDTKGDVKLTITKNVLRDIHSEDVADILEELSREERIHIFNALDSKTAADALGATEPRVQREILSSVDPERVREIFSHLSPVEIAQIISVLPLENAQEFRITLRPEVAAKVHEIVTRHDVPASALAMRRFLAFPGDITVEEAFKKYRQEARNSAVTMYIYIVDAAQHLKGVLDINELLQADPEKKLEELMTRNVVSVSPTTMRGEVEALFRRYGFRAIPVLDDERKIVSVIREKGIVLSED
jgi:CBS domain-containing protein